MDKIKKAKIKIEKDLQDLEKSLNKSLKSKINLATEISSYTISSGGKRIRPLLSIFIARCLNYSGKELIKLCTAIELLHTATLIHDDVVDESDTRRGKPSVNKKWDIMHSVLVGDFVYSKAFQNMSSLKNPEIIKVLANSTNMISEGEVMQLSLKASFLSEKDYFQIISNKTAELFKASAVSAALLSDASTEELKFVKHLAFSLGIIFQINDDILDYFGDSQRTGKQIGQDLSEGKITLPLIKTYNLSSTKEKKIIKNSLGNSTKKNITLIKNLIQSSGALKEVLDIRDKYYKTCIRNTKKLPSSNFRKLLENTINELVQIDF